jgi:hypothetical protein
MNNLLTIVEPSVLGGVGLIVEKRVAESELSGSKSYVFHIVYINTGSN